MVRAVAALTLALALTWSGNATAQSAFLVEPSAAQFGPLGAPQLAPLHDPLRLPGLPSSEGFGSLELGLRVLQESPRLFDEALIGLSQSPAVGCSSASDQLWSSRCAPNWLGDGLGMALARSNPHTVISAAWLRGPTELTLLASDDATGSLLLPAGVLALDSEASDWLSEGQWQSPLSIGVLGALDTGRFGWLQLGAQLSRSHTSGVLRAERQEASMALALYYGTLSGFVQGRIESTEIGTGLGLQQVTRGLDIGLSWRMPWQARLSVGARNVVSGSSAEAIEPPPQRTPYVRYHQDF